MKMMLEKLQKQSIAIRYWLLAKGYFKALAAMEFAASYHTGKRKDNITPEFSHQIAIAHFIRTLSLSLVYPEETIAAAFLHDVTEDYSVEVDELKTLFSDQIANSVWLLTKKFKGVKKSLEMYYSEMAKDPIASICKGCDRIHNIQSMVDVFTHSGQKWYVEETKLHILPMIKVARRLFPQQELAYENIKHMLTNQVELIEIIHRHKEANNEPTS
jgi:(p)ppGpp synthase/HD superfamily hydrolase